MCFYCRSAIQLVAGQVDHFVPWSRYPVNLGHNFVLAHNKCNGAKGSMLASEEHLTVWMERNRDLGATIASEFEARGFVHDLPGSIQVARWAYDRSFETGGLTWRRGKELLHLQPGWEGWPVFFASRSAWSSASSKPTRRAPLALRCANHPVAKIALILLNTIPHLRGPSSPRWDLREPQQNKRPKRVK